MPDTFGKGWKCVAWWGTPWGTHRVTHLEVTQWGPLPKLRQSSNAVVKLGEAASKISDSNLSFCLSKPNMCVVSPKFWQFEGYSMHTVSIWSWAWGWNWGRWWGCFCCWHCAPKSVRWFKLEYERKWCNNLPSNFTPEETLLSYFFHFQKDSCEIL